MVLIYIDLILTSGYNMWPPLGKAWQDAMDLMIGGCNWAIEEAKANLKN
jgi:hypothetical protein